MADAAVRAEERVVDEACPLLPSNEGEGPKARSFRRVLGTLPIGQLATLCALRLADPIAFTQIFPYVNEMMENFGVVSDPSQTGFYSGLVESVFAISQLVSIYQWANLSDRIGRRPVVLLGTLGIAATTVILGFSKTLAAVLITRSLAGLFSGNVAVMHSVLGELTDASNQAIAFPMYGLCWPLGVIIGPLIGGTFSNPAHKFPSLFHGQVFTYFPYLLPCLIIAGLILLSVIIGFFFLRETLPPKARQFQDYAKSYGVYKQPDVPLESARAPSAKALLGLPVMRALCFSGFALSFVGTAFDVVFVLFCYSPIAAGGLSFSVSQIGYALALAGISSASIQLFIMPFLLRKFTCARLYTFAMGLWPFTFLILPLLNSLARIGLDEATNDIDNHVRSIVWIGIGVALALSRVACLAFSLNMILVKDHAPGPTSLGSANGLAQFFQCLARAIAPAFVSSLFAYSMNVNLMGGNAWVAIMLILSCVSWAHSYTVPEDTPMCSPSDLKSLGIH